MKQGDSEQGDSSRGGSGKPYQLHRRQLLRLAATAACGGAAALALMPKPAQAIGTLSDLLTNRTLSFLNVHTAQRLVVPFGPDGKVVPTAMAPVIDLLHDHHDGSSHTIDPRLLDVLLAIVRTVGGGSSTLIHVTSGYRSPRTNAMLRLTDDGVAATSFHMRGQAIDFWIPDCPLAELHRAALAVRGGGVGYYPLHGFLHVDTGPIRQWGPYSETLTAGRGVSPPLGRETVMVNGRPMHLTPIQRRQMAMHQRALLWDHQHRKLIAHLLSQINGP